MGTASRRRVMDTDRRAAGSRPGVAALVVGALAALALAGCSPPTGVNASASPSDPTPTGSAAVDNTSGMASPSVVASRTDDPQTGPAPQPGPSGTTTTTGADESGAGRLVNPIVVYAGVDVPSGTVRVDAFVPDVIEDGGTCTATLSNGAARVSAAAPAAGDATATWCETVVLRLDDLETGTWEAVVQYTSTGSAGTSPPVTVEVP